MTYLDAGASHLDPAGPEEGVAVCGAECHFGEL